MNVHDVAVVGAGPAGSVTAGILAGHGYDVLLLDRAIFPRDKACAEYCSPGIEDVLRRIGAWDAVASRVRRIRGMTVYIDGRAVLPVTYPNRSHSRLAFTMPRRDFDSALVRYAARRGAQLVEGTRVTAVSRDQRQVGLLTESRSGELHQWHARMVVGADGMHSTVARSLGIAASSHQPYRVGLISHFEGVDGLAEMGEMHVGRGLYCGLAPLPQGRVNVGLVMPLRAGSDHRNVQARFDAGLARLPKVRERLLHGRAVSRLRGMGPMTRRVASVAGPGYLLIGDAAGFLDPFTGEGIYKSVRGAEIAAGIIEEQLVRATGGKTLPDLSEYAARRHREFAGKEVVTWFIQAALSRPRLLARLCRNITASASLAETVGNVLGDVEAARDLLNPGHLARLLAPYSSSVRNNQGRGLWRDV